MMTVLATWYSLGIQPSCRCVYYLNIFVIFFPATMNHEGPGNFLTLTAGYVLSQTAVLILYFSLRKFLLFLLLSLTFQQVCFFVSLGGAGLSYNGNNCYCLQLG